MCGSRVARRHDMKLGVSKVGQNTGPNGHRIFTCDPPTESDWQVALDRHILPRLDETCERLGFVDFSA